MEVLNDPSHGTEDKETYLSEQRRKEEEEKLEDERIRCLEEATRLDVNTGISNEVDMTKLKREKKRTPGPRSRRTL